MTRAAASMGLVALLLAAAGLLAVVSYVVAMRTREFAIRIALGARPRTVVALVVRQAMRMVIIGVAIGGTVALGVTHAIRAQSRYSAGADYAAFLGSAALLIVVMLVATAVPAIRAARVDPVANLREG